MSLNLRMAALNLAQGEWIRFDRGQKSWCRRRESGGAVETPGVHKIDYKVGPPGSSYLRS